MITENQNIEPEDLIIRYIAGECNDQEKLHAEELLAKNPALQKLYSDYNSLYSASEDYNIEDNFDTEKAIDSFKQHINKKKESESPSQNFFTKKRLSIITSFAASVLLIIGYFIFHIYNEDTYFELKSSDIVKTDTVFGKTIISINTNTNTRIFEKDDENRIVQLDFGEALFTVEPDPNKPFIVKTPLATVTVLGTIFNINAYSHDSICISVLEGIVKVESKQEKQVITKGEALTVYKNEKEPLKKSTFSDPNCIYWNTHKLSFTKARLKNVISVLNEKLEINIDIVDSAIAEAQLTASFSNKNTSDILNVIAETFNASIFEADSTYYIIP